MIRFPWTLRAVGFYDGMVTGTDLQIDHKIGGNDVTVWFNKKRMD